jgi:uncharacterized protein (UPF0261 family)
VVELRNSIVIIRNLDTRGEDIVFVNDLIRARGHEAIPIDFSMETAPPLPGDWFRKTPYQYADQLETAITLIETEAAWKMATADLAATRAEPMLHLF